MSDEDYNKCRSCRFCLHEGDKWVCYFTGESNVPDHTCMKYRPGMCESCSFYLIEGDKETCNMNFKEIFGLDVCLNYDPGCSK
ncbi:MAG TPA: hypothetical protein VJX93_05170 [Candidatus Methanomethylophilaceae archaeon]|nr:hypothetical protein [Candidatus Methanomethylophilaceae archaeon]